MDFTEKIFNTFLLLIGAAFVVMIYPVLSGIFIPALLNSGMFGVIFWAPIVIPVVYSVSIFVVVIILFLKVWHSDFAPV